MPLTIRVRNPTAPAASYLIDSQPIYDNTYIPCQDFKKEHPEDAYPNQHGEEELLVEEYAREVPFYAEEEAFPEAAELCEAPAPTVEMPDMVHEIRQYFPHSVATRWMPPPPPTHTIERSPQPMRFWYTRLVAHPLHASCIHLAGFRCPGPHDFTNDEDWAAVCSQWWETLSAVMVDRELTEITPSRSWNPYDLRNNVRFHDVRRTAAKLAVDAVRGNPEAGRFPVPPPPEYGLFMSECAPLLDRALGERLYTQALVRWWRMAAQWAAATAMKRPWVCPPPTTDVTPLAWGAAVDTWWTLTVSEMRVEDEKAARQAERKTKNVPPSPAVTPRAVPLSHTNDSRGGSDCGTSATSPSLSSSACVPTRSLNGLQLW